MKSIWMSPRSVLLAMSFSFGLTSCSTVPKEPETPTVVAATPTPKPWRSRAPKIAPIGEFRNTSAPAPLPEVQAKSNPFWAQAAQLDRDSTPYKLLFGGLLWAILTLLSIFYRYQLRRDGIVARAMVAFLIAIPFTLYWVTASPIALAVLLGIAGILAIATFAGWRRERRELRLRARPAEDSAVDDSTANVPVFRPGLTRAPDLENTKTAEPLQDQSRSNRLKR